MPIYLAHGFRWPREGFTGIRVHAIVNNLDDVSVEYIQNEHSRSALLTNLRSLYPSIMNTFDQCNRKLDFLEQYDPEDLSPSAVSQPYAFVCDWVVMIAGGNDAEHHAGNLLQSQRRSEASTPPESRPISNVTTSSTSTTSHPQRKQVPKQRAKTQPMSIAAPFNSPATITALSVNMEEVMADSPPLSTEAWDALADLRDKLAESEKIGWWVVYNGDPDRYYDESEDEDDEDEGKEEKTETETEDTIAGAGTGASAQAEAEKVRGSAASQQSAGAPLDIQRVRSPTGGRVPPPIPPPPSKSPRSSTQAPSKPLPLPIRGPTQDPEPKEKERKELQEPKSKDAPKSPGLRKKIFGKK